MSKRRKPGKSSRAFRRIQTAAKNWRFRVRARLGLLRLANRGYMICATPRTGSNYLCQLLTSTDMLGKPVEYFNVTPRRRTHDPKYPEDPRVQLNIVRSWGATQNGIYAVKLLSTQFKLLGDRVDPFRDLPNLTLVRLERRDLLGQAISLVRARQTLQYVGCQVPAAAPAYDQRRIRSCLRQLQDQRAVWDGIMTRLGMQPLFFHYEDMVNDPQGTIDQIAALMGLVPPVPIDPGLVTHRVQRDATSAEWRRQFLIETGDEFGHLAGVATPRSIPGSASAS
jgi:trehalose 2-sulfotransferase